MDLFGGAVFFFFWFLDTDQELEFKIKNHNATLEEAKNERERKRKEQTDEADKLRRYEEKRSVVQTSHGRLQSEKQVRSAPFLFDLLWCRWTDLVTCPFSCGGQRHEAAKAKRQELIQRISARHQIPGYNGILSDDEMTSFEAELDNAIRDQQRKLEETKVRVILPLFRFFLLALPGPVFFLIDFGFRSHFFRAQRDSASKASLKRFKSSRASKRRTRKPELDCKPKS